MSTETPRIARTSPAKKSIPKRIARLVGALFFVLLPLFQLVSQRKRKKPMLIALGAVSLAALFLGMVLLFSLPKSTSALQDLKDPSIPKDVTIKKMMAETGEFIDQGKFKQAEANVRELFKLRPNNASIYTLSGALKSFQKDYDSARTDYHAALKLNPKSFSAAFNLAEVDFVTGNYSSAREQFQTLLADRPTDEILLFRVYLCALMENKPRLAESTLESFPSVGKTPARQYAEAARLHHEKKTSEARKVVKAARVLYPDKTKFFDSSLEIIGYE